MIDYKQLDSIYELTKKHEKLSNKKTWVNIKLGVHPSACQFKLTIGLDGNGEGIHVYESADDLLDKLKELCEIEEAEPRFKIGETIWFKDCDNKILFLTVASIKKNLNRWVYIDGFGAFVTDDDTLFKSKNELIDHEIKKLIDLKD